MAGVIATIPKFQFSANGVPMVGGTLDTYIAGSTTPATTWQDSALTIANTNPISLDARGECVLWLDSAVVYKFVLKNAAGVIQWTQDNISNPAALANSLRAALAASSGASLVGFQQEGTGAVATDVQSKLQERVSVEDFSALTGSAAVNAAILKVALTGGGTVKCTAPTYTWLTTILIPSNVRLDLGNAVITGPGIGSATDLFQTGYLSGGAIVTNIGTANESHLITNTRIHNGTIQNAGAAFNLFNFIDGCKVSDIRFVDCVTCVKALRSWYSGYVNLFSRGTAGGTALPAFVFDSFTNVMNIESVFAEGRAKGWDLTGGANGQTLFNIASEAGTTGVTVTGQTGPLKFDTPYIEGITGVGIDLSGAGRKNVTFDNGWFYQCGTAIKSNTAGAYLHIKKNNVFSGNTVNVDTSDNISDKSRVEIPDASISDTGYALVPATYLLGRGNDVDYNVFTHDSGSGLPIVKTKVNGNALIAFNHEGNAGQPKTGTVSFCVHSKTAGTTFDVLIDTKITYSQFGSLLVYRFEISDNSNVYQLFGLVFGDTVKALDATVKVVTVANVGGFVQLRLSSFNHPTGVYGCTGTLRHV